MKSNAEKPRGEEGFEKYYGGIFGSDWPPLKAALLAEGIHAKLEYPGKEPYFLDPASVCAALCLPLEGASSVLDMCAAPGGKSLVLAGSLMPGSSLHSNERSAQRKIRLDHVLEHSLPPELYALVRTTGYDAALLCRRKELSYGSILLDAPCSSERHVLADPHYLAQWSPARVKSLAMEQWALLSSAWRLLSPGGFLVYSTCALAPSENDGVLRRLIQKFSDVQFASQEECAEHIRANAEKLSPYLTCPHGTEPVQLFSHAIRTECGWHLLPHAACGTGPLYFSLLHKIPSSCL